MGDDRSYNFLIFAVVVFIVQAIWILFDLNLGPEPIIGNVLICLISFTAVIATFKVHKSIPKNFSKEKTALLFLLSAIILFFLGDLNWFIEEVFLNSTSLIGGLSDILWFGAYMCAIISIIFFILIGFSSSRKGFGAVILLGLIFGGVLLYYSVYDSLINGTLTFSLIVQEMYLVYDIILLLLIIYLVHPLMSMGQKSIFYSWISLGLSVITIAVYDFIFAGLSKSDSYYTGHPIDLVYSGFYLLIILACSIKISSLNKRGKPAPK